MNQQHSQVKANPLCTHDLFFKILFDLSKFFAWMQPFKMILLNVNKI